MMYGSRKIFCCKYIVLSLVVLTILCQKQENVSLSFVRVLFSDTWSQWEHSVSYDLIPLYKFTNHQIRH